MILCIAWATLAVTAGIAAGVTVWATSERLNDG